MALQKIKGRPARSASPPATADPLVCELPNTSVLDVGLIVLGAGEDVSMRVGSGVGVPVGKGFIVGFDVGVDAFINGATGT